MQNSHPSKRESGRCGVQKSEKANRDLRNFQFSISTKRRMEFCERQCQAQNFQSVHCMHCPEAEEWHPIKVFPEMKVAHSLSLSLSLSLGRVLEIAEKHPSQVPFLTTSSSLHSYFCEPIFVPSEQLSGLKLLPLAKLDSNRVTNRLYWTRDSRWKAHAHTNTYYIFLFRSFIRNLGIRRSEFFS